VVNFGLIGTLSRRFSPRTLTIWSALHIAPLIAVVVFPGSLNALWFTLPPATLAMAICLTACATLLSTSVGPDEQGRVMGNNMSLQTGAEAVSGLLAGALAVIAIKLPLLATSWAAVLAALILLGWWPPAARRPSRGAQSSVV
jgi:predicted MFS family arabinose efflux permease